MERQRGVQREALANARRHGYLVNRRPYDEAECAYREWCRLQRRPLVVVSVGRRYANGLIDYAPTERLDGDPAVGLTMHTLSALGAQSVRAFFDAHAAPNGRLFCAYTGSDSLAIGGIPAAMAEQLGEVLAEAASACDPAGGAGAATSRT